MRRCLALALFPALAAAFILAGCERDEGYPGSRDRNGALKDSHTVEMTDAHAFKPMEINVNVGDSVVWKNTSKDMHSVSTDPEKVAPARKDWVKVPEGAKPFDSGDVRPGSTWKHTFSMPGVYKYVCTHHQEHGMTGTVTVKPIN